MPAKIIDGNKIAKSIIEDIKNKVKSMKEKPGFALVIVGNNPASEVYVNLKERESKEIGFYCERYNLDENTSEMDLLKLINGLNNNPKIHGILVQVPLPKQIDEKVVTDSILPHKDVDGFTAISLGNLFSGKVVFAPATARGVISLIES